MNNNLYKNLAFIIGNGESRKDFDLNKLKGVGTVFGCNALYRDFSPDFRLPDYLISIDEVISLEITMSDFPRQRHLRAEGQDATEFPYSNRRNNAGMVAMHKAIQRGYTTIVALGFDFLIDDNLEVSNLYDGTNGYGMETRTNKHDNYFRLQYLEWFATKNSDINFKFVFPKEVTKFKSIKSPNIKGMFYWELNEWLQNGTNID